MVANELVQNNFNLDLINIDPAFIVKRLTQVVAFQAKVKSLLVENVDYGVIKGVSTKPTLFKAGAEKIILALRLHPKFEILKMVENANDKGFYSYVIKCVIYQDEKDIAQGLGGANSKEPKWAYKWLEKSYFPADVDVTKLPSKFSNNKKVYRTEDEVNSKANTILKIAKKRAMVDAVLNVGALSEVFTQDFDDMPEPLETQQDSEVSIKVPQAENVITISKKCSDCNCVIPNSINDYSQKYYKKPLCLNCQKKYNKSKLVK